MRSSEINEATPTKPDSLRLAELAVAAGTAGYPLIVRWRYYPPPVLTSIWQHHMKQLGKNEVLQVHRPGDLKCLADDVSKDDVSKLRLVVVPYSRVAEAAAWLTVLSRPKLDGMIAPRPTLFSRFPEQGADEDPGATLVLHGRAPEIKAVTDYLESPSLSRAGLTCKPPAVVEFEPVLVEQVLGDQLRRQRDRQVVRGLLAGACLLRHHGNGERLKVVVQDYTEVYSLLQGPVAQPADEPLDSLAVAMVARAIAYLHYKSQRATGAAPKSARIEDYPSGRGPNGTNIITRRELADLGNNRSPLLTDLVNYLVQHSDGYKLFGRLDGDPDVAKGENWPTKDPAALIAQLALWSPKQVRTHFHRLYLEDLIDGKRSPSNGPWQYTLPTEISWPSSAFRELPKPDSLTKGAPTGPIASAPALPSGLPTLPAVGPAQVANENSD